jgi:NTP pyrophosphatase (non-canonical NTP hydrolase)
MRVQEYQEKAAGSAQYPEYALVLYPLLGLIGEAGELAAKFYDGMWPYGLGVPDGEEPFQDALLAFVTVARRCETLKKQIRGGTANLDDAQKKRLKEQVQYVLSAERDQLEGEAGDCAWYLSAIIGDMNGNLEDVLATNLEKLAKRKATGTIHNHKPDSREDKE